MWRIIGEAILLVAVLVVGLPYAISFVWHEAPFMGTSFTPEAWAQAGSCAGLTDLQCETKWQQCERGAMFRTLAKDHLPLGKITKMEALKLLGDAREIELRGNLCLRYPLGYCSGLGVDIDYLQLCFDRQQLLISKLHFQS